MPAIGVVDATGELTVRLHTALPQGPVLVELLLPDSSGAGLTTAGIAWPVFSVGAVKPGFTMEREDLYGDSGT